MHISNYFYFKTELIDYWITVSEQLLRYLNFINVRMLDIFLVGSVAFGLSQDKSDIDSLVLIDNDTLLLDSLKFIRGKIQNYLHKIDHKKIYHFKLFNKKELSSLGFYDGFRLYEFQLHYFSLKGSEYLKQYNPLLSFKNFCNSIFIQTVYEYFENGLNPPFICKDFLFNIYLRITRNKLILYKEKKNSSLFNKSEAEILEICLNFDKLFRFLYIITTKKLCFKYLLWLINQYIRRFPHEYVNKFEAYMECLKLKQESPK